MTNQVLHKIVEDIIVELKIIADAPKPYRDVEDEFPLPRLIPTGDGRQIYISKKIEFLISRIASIKMEEGGEEGEQRRRRYSKKDMHSLIRSSLGSALIKITLSEDIKENSHVVLESILGEIESASDRVISSQKEYAFGCDLFFYKDIGPVDIGPVRFEPRKIWLERKASDGRYARIVHGGRIVRFSHKVADGPISAIARRRILRAWRGEKLKKRRPSFDSWNETDILQAIGDSAYVCSVRLEGLDGIAGKNKALLAARLALTVLALRWERPSGALVKVKIAPDKSAGYRKIVSFTPDGLMYTEGVGTKERGESWCDREEVEQSLINNKGIFDVFGESIGWLLNPSKVLENTNLYTALLHALIMFQEGCVSDIDQLAVAKFVSALDVLSCGGSQGGVLELLCRCFSQEPSKKITPDGLTINSFVQQIYGKGRNKMFHGGNKMLDHDWSKLRAQAEWVTRAVLISCAEKLANDTTSGKPKKFFLKRG